MTSFTNDCEHVFHSVDSVRNHFIMDWKNALTHFDTFVDRVDNVVHNIADDLFEEEDADTDEDEADEPEEDHDLCIFQFEL
jgi:hypothetical protein